MVLLSESSDCTSEEKQFAKFIEYYEDYFLPAHKIAENKLKKTILPTDNGRNQFPMYALDEICKTVTWVEDNIYYTPKTTDAIFCKKEDGKFKIFLIEFKGDKLYNFSKKYLLCDYIDDLINKKKYASKYEKEDIQRDINKLTPVAKKYSDKMLLGLASKPIETINVSLPLIYEDYYNNNKDKDGVEHINILQFLYKSTIIYRVVACDENDENPFRDRSNSYRLSNIDFEECKISSKKIKKESNQEVTENYRENLNSYYLRYLKANIFDEYDFLNARNFNNFIIDYLK